MIESITFTVVVVVLVVVPVVELLALVVDALEMFVCELRTSGLVET
jgi:hypothetical protein